MLRTRIGTSHITLYSAPEKFAVSNAASQFPSTSLNQNLFTDAELLAILLGILRFREQPVGLLVDKVCSCESQSGAKSKQHSHSSGDATTSSKSFNLTACLLLQLFPKLRRLRSLSVRIRPQATVPGRYRVNLGPILHGLFSSILIVN